jgi:hypothetical protein
LIAGLVAVILNLIIPHEQEGDAESITSAEIVNHEHVDFEAGRKAEKLH